MRTIKDALIIRNSDFGLLWLSQVLSQVGNRMFQLAMVWWILKNYESSSGMILATFLISSALPPLLLMKSIGTWVDRLPARRILLRSDFIGALAASVMALTFYFDWMSPSLLVLFNLIFSICQGLIDPTLQKSAQEIVGEEDLNSAVSYLSSTQSLASFAGAIIGTLLIERLGPMAIVLLNGLSYFLSYICDGIVKFKYSSAQVEAPSEETLPYSMPKILSQVLFGFAIVNFFLTPLMMILPLYVNKVLKGNAELLAFMEAHVWLGLLSGIFLSRYFANFKKSLSFVSLCLIFLAAFLLVPAFFADAIKEHTSLYGISLFLASFFLGLLNVRMMGLFQKIVPPHHKGSFFARLQGNVSFTLPLAYFAFGVGSDYMAVTDLCLIQSLGIFAMGLFYLRFFGLTDQGINGEAISKDLKSAEVL